MGAVEGTAKAAARRARAPGATAGHAGPPMRQGQPCRILRVAGPLVEMAYTGETAMYDLVSLGGAGLPGEVVAISSDVVTVQAYEYTGGLAPGDLARPQGGPLAARLGPELLGGIFDGLLRPLSGAGDWLSPETVRGGAAGEHTWPFAPLVKSGTRISPGAALGDIRTPDLTSGRQVSPVRLRVLAPPDCRGVVDWIAPAGEYGREEVVAVVGGTEVRIGATWPIRRPRPARERVDPRRALNTGQRAIDLLFPVALGSTVAVPGGFGTGKTVLLQQIAKWCDTDVIVYIGCGERGNEMADAIADFAALDDPRTGGRLADRTVTVANTSNMPMMAREASIYTGATVAEYFRDMGLDVVVIADSTSRWAEALREFASRTGALPAEEGYPAGLASAIAAFYERAGAVTTLGGDHGSVTIIGAVSPPGGDLTEPVTAHTERFVRCLWSLDRDLAYARHYPAISWAGSFSRDLLPPSAGQPPAAGATWAARRDRVAAILAEADRLADLVELVGITALPDPERVSVLAGRLVREAVLQQSALSERDAYCAPDKTAALVDAVLAVVDGCRELVAAGVPAATVEEVDFGPVVRAREDVGPQDAAGVTARQENMLARLARLREARP